MDTSTLALKQERIACSAAAAERYGIPPRLLLAVAEQEGGRPGQWVRNRNGTFDVGSLQFNTAYLSDLARFGITPAHVAAHGCYPYELAAWRLRGHLNEGGADVWTLAANYHSRTPSANARYRAQLVARAAQGAVISVAAARSTALAPRALKSALATVQAAARAATSVPGFGAAKSPSIREISP